MERIKKYFPNITEQQTSAFAALFDLYSYWNQKINVISRKDIDNLYLHHILHSLAIAKLIKFKPGTRIIDVGTGGGFPGIPLAIMFPDSHFHLIDSIGKKIKVAQEVASAIELYNCTFEHRRMEQEKEKFDFIISRAVMPLDDLVKISRKNVSFKNNNAIPNGIICLKGGDLTQETKKYKNIIEIYDINEFYEEEYFSTKKLIHLPIFVS